jgi:hypothetical protein
VWARNAPTPGLRFRPKRSIGTEYHFIRKRHCCYRPSRGETVILRPSFRLETRPLPVANSAFGAWDIQSVPAGSREARFSPSQGCELKFPRDFRGRSLGRSTARFRPKRLATGDRAGRDQPGPCGNRGSGRRAQRGVERFFDLGPIIQDVQLLLALAILDLAAARLGTILRGWAPGSGPSTGTGRST